MTDETKKHKILIVDDDPVSGQLIQKRLEMREFVTYLVTGGKECLDEIEENTYDMVLLDIVMPEVSGLDVLDKVRETKNTFELPIIMVTSKSETSDVVDALRRGANDYVTKPVNMDIAMARITTQIQVKELIQESLVLKQAATINTMVGTLNHEINNPLAVAVGNISILKKSFPEEKKIAKAEIALDRIAQIVKKIEKISEGDIEEINYSSESNIYKV